MIKIEELTIKGRMFIRTWSSDRFMIERDGIRYSEAIDPAEFNRQYVETDEAIDDEELTETEIKARAYDIITGVIE